MNVLWDNGSTISFVTFKWAEMMKLKGRQEKMQLLKFGEIEGEHLSSVKYKFKLIDRSGVETVIEAYGVDKITSDICNINSEMLQKLFKGSNMEDYNRPENGTVHCLIGSDYLSIHPVQEEAVGNLVLLRNKYGSIIAGRHHNVCEGTQKYVKNVQVLHISRGFSDFYALEQLETQCTPALEDASAGNATLVDRTCH